MRGVVALFTAFVSLAIAQSSTSASNTALTLSGTNSDTISGGDYATGTYESYTTTITQPTSNSYVTITGTTSNATTSTSYRTETITTNGTTITRTSATQTILSGRPSSSSNGTSTRNSTSTSSAAQPTNTTPCNGHAAFCNRKYSNITMITAHNSPFVRPGNAAANQALQVTAQLNDGIRMLQFQVHQPNGTGTDLYMCHTSCSLLNAGLLLDYLITVKLWMDAHPYEVVTILMGNYDMIDPDNFVGPVQDSGLLSMIYTPSSVPMGLNDWPTLGSMILGRQRVVMMLDYKADQNEIPWLLDEFGNMWETPFSPTDPTFPCTQQRPPNQGNATSRDRLYMANHNLNIDVEVAGISLLIPAYTLLDQVNAVSGNMSLGGMSENCTTMWDRPPNFLLVDYYNFGNFNGSVFQVAADMNGVSYDKNRCCDTNGVQSAGASLRAGFSLSSVGLFGVVTLFIIL